jgi:hypothetical protein
MRGARGGGGARRARALRAALLAAWACAMCRGALPASAALGGAVTPRAPPHAQPLAPQLAPGGTLLVGLVDGSVHALDALSGACAHAHARTRAHHFRFISRLRSLRAHRCALLCLCARFLR